jgi:Rrf2 family cysteine metabolism transcriptional repressor
MIFSSKAEYGVRLMIELGRQVPLHPTSLKAIADAEGLRLLACAAGRGDRHG